MLKYSNTENWVHVIFSQSYSLKKENTETIETLEKDILSCYKDSGGSGLLIH